MTSDAQNIEIKDYSGKTYASQKRYTYLCLITCTLGFLDVDPNSSIFGFKFETFNEFQIVCAFAIVTLFAGLHYWLRLREEHDVFSDLSERLEELSNNLKNSLDSIRENEQTLSNTVNSISTNTIPSLEANWKKLDKLTRKPHAHYLDIESSNLVKVIDDISDKLLRIVKSEEFGNEIRQLKGQVSEARLSLNKIKSGAETHINEKNEQLITIYNSVSDGLANLPALTGPNNSILKISDSINCLEKEFEDKIFSIDSRKKLASKQQIRIFLFEWLSPFVLISFVLFSVYFDFTYHHSSKASKAIVEIFKTPSEPTNNECIN